MTPTTDATGIFSPFRAGALAGVTGYSIGQWSRYGLIKPTLFRGRPANLYEFRDVAEAIVVHWLVDRGFDYRAIHEAIERARTDYGDWPLLDAPIGVAQHAIEGDPRGRIVLEVKRQVYVDTGHGGNQVTLKPELLVRARDMLHRGGWLADKLELERIEVDPAKLGGMPVLRGRRWPIERVAQLAADEAGVQVLLEDYGLDQRDITESVCWTDAATSL
jgi:uncharacterized protein (DUF433 family)/DNA-binding transcriptional MerR regulator